MMPADQIDPGRAITTLVSGGLGNQLFQYCAGRALAQAHNVPLLLDTQWFQRRNDRDFGLRHFSHVGVIASKRQLPFSVPTYIGRKLHRRWLASKGRRLLEESNTFDPRVKNAKPGVHLDGYWQVPAYFEHLEATLRQELQFVSKPTDRNMDMLKELEQRPTISVHVRRGDYLSDKHKGTFAVCNPDYYARAVETLLDRVPDDYQFAVFSDDLAWARQNIILPGPSTYVDWNSGGDAWQDMRLMSACRHHIIANSTFSWWGAWLNPNPDKIVVSPKTWYVTPTMSNDHITPRGWITVDNPQ